MNKINVNEIDFSKLNKLDVESSENTVYLDDKNEKLRRFCDPNVIDRTLIIEYAYKYGERLQNK